MNVDNSKIVRSSPEQKISRSIIMQDEEKGAENTKKSENHIILPWPKKLRQARTSNYRRVHARDSRACARWRVAVPIFLARVAYK